MTAVHQFIPTFARRDAVGSHTLQARSVLRDLGYDSEIYAADAAPDAREFVKPYQSYRPRAHQPTWLLYQASTGTFMAEWFRARPEPKIVNYHNITPAPFFEGWEPHVAAELSAGRHQLQRLASTTDLALADSRYNATELVDVGYRDVRVAPILLDVHDFERAVDERALDAMRRAKPAGSAEWLFIGRLAPNKCQHDIVKAFAWYRAVFDPGARLRLIGGTSSAAYERTIRTFITEAGLTDAVELTGSVTGGELSAALTNADVFVCLSEHEGFCVPLLEAMHERVPVVAYAATAVPETLGAAGILLPSKSAALVAAAVHRVVGDHALANQLRDAGEARLARFALDRTTQEFGGAVQSRVEGG